MPCGQWHRLSLVAVLLLIIPQFTFPLAFSSNLDRCPIVIPSDIMPAKVSSNAISGSAHNGPEYFYDLEPSTVTIKNFLEPHGIKIWDDSFRSMDDSIATQKELQRREESTVYLQLPTYYLAENFLGENQHIPGHLDTKKRRYFCLYFAWGGDQTQDSFARLRLFCGFTASSDTRCLLLQAWNMRIHIDRLLHSGCLDKLSKEGFLPSEQPMTRTLLDGVLTDLPTAPVPIQFFYPGRDAPHNLARRPRKQIGVRGRVRVQGRWRDTKVQIFSSAFQTS